MPKLKVEALEVEPPAHNLRNHRLFHPDKVPVVGFQNERLGIEVVGKRLHALVYTVIQPEL